MTAGKMDLLFVSGWSTPSSPDMHTFPLGFLNYSCHRTFKAYMVLPSPLFSNHSTFLQSAIWKAFFIISGFLCVFAPLFQPCVCFTCVLSPSVV